MKYLTFLLLICQVATLKAQSAEIDRSFLTIMVIPYTGPDEGVKLVIEKNEVCRALLGQINQVFEERGYRTKDYMAILNLSSSAPDAADLERTENIEAIKNARVDVIIYVEIKLRELSESDKQLQLQLQAIDQYSAENYANSISVESTRRRFSDFSQAAREAQLVKQLNVYADQLDKKFTDILQNGRTVTVKVSTKPSSQVNLRTLPDDGEIDLSGSIDEWIRSRTVKVYSPSGDGNYWLAECKLPVMDEKQRSVTPFSFRSDLIKYLQQLRFSGQPLKIDNQTINSVIELILE